MFIFNIRHKLMFWFSLVWYAQQKLYGMARKRNGKN